MKQLCRTPLGRFMSQFFFQGRIWTASRLVMRWSGVELADDQHAAHRCDNVACVNPEHLFAASRHDNMRDAAQKGRLSTFGRPSVGQCRNGHPRTPHNTRLRRSPHRPRDRQVRFCLDCHSARLERMRLARLVAVA